MKVSVTQLCPTICNPMDWSLLGCSVHGILQARTLEWVDIPFSQGSPWPRDWTRVSCMAGIFFTVWATGKNICKYLNIYKYSKQFANFRETQIDGPCLIKDHKTGKICTVLTFALLTTPRHRRNMFWVFLLGKGNIRVYLYRDFIWSNRVDPEAEFLKGKRRKIKCFFFVFFFGCGGSVLLHMDLVLLRHVGS